MVGNDKVKHAHMKRKTIGHEEIFEFLASECIGDAEMWNRIPTLLNRCYELRDQELTEKKPGAKKTETGMEGQDEDTGPQKSEYARVNAGEVFCEDFFLYLGKVHLMCEIEVNVKLLLLVVFDVALVWRIKSFFPTRHTLQGIKPVGFLH